MKKLSIAERQKRWDKICEIAEYIVPIIVSSAASVLLSIMILQ